MVKKENENNLRLGMGGEEEEPDIMDNEDSFDDYSDHADNKSQHSNKK